MRIVTEYDSKEYMGTKLKGIAWRKLENINN